MRQPQGEGPEEYNLNLCGVCWRFPSALVMPFCKRTVLPKDVCKPAGRGLQQEAQPRPRQRRAALEDLVDVCGFTLCSLLRQLSDLSRHSVSILEELEGDLATICHRSCVLEGRVVRLQRRVADLISKPPPKGRSQLKSTLSRTRRERAWWRRKTWWKESLTRGPTCLFAAVCRVRMRRGTPENVEI